MNPRTDALLNRWLDGQLDPAEAAALQRMMVEDPELRQAYYELLTVDQLLAERGEELSPQQEVIDFIADGIDAPRGRSFSWERSLSIAAIGFNTGLKFPAIQANPAGRWRAGVGERTLHHRQHRQPLDRRPAPGTTRDGRWERCCVWSAAPPCVELNPTTSANVEGPAAIELMDRSGNIRLLEGMASFAVSDAGNHLDVHVPGGVLRNPEGSRFTTEVSSRTASQTCGSNPLVRKSAHATARNRSI